MIGGGLLVLLIIVVVVVAMMMKKKSSQPVQPQPVQPQPVQPRPITFFFYSKSFTKYIVINMQGGSVTWTDNASLATPFSLDQDGTLSYKGFYLCNSINSEGVQSQPQSKFGGTVGALVSNNSVNNLLRAYILNSVNVLKSSGNQVQNVYVAVDRNASGTGLDLNNLKNNYGVTWYSGLTIPQIYQLFSDSTNSYIVANDPNNIVQLIPKMALQGQMT